MRLLFAITSRNCVVVPRSFPRRLYIIYNLLAHSTSPPFHIINNVFMLWPFLKQSIAEREIFTTSAKLSDIRVYELYWRLPRSRHWRLKTVTYYTAVIVTAISRHNLCERLQNYRIGASLLQIKVISYSMWVWSWCYCLLVSCWKLSLPAITTDGLAVGRTAVVVGRYKEACRSHSSTWNYSVYQPVSSSERQVEGLPHVGRWGMLSYTILITWSSSQRKS